ncbi:MAG TPA: hypothetical protein VGS23_05420 [Thermoplasmata archaeon]|nr:hypothetical protein [Thermoplasmata archaeon]
MRVESHLVRDFGERAPPIGLFVKVRTPRGRPRATYRSVLRSAEAVERARRRRVPVFLLTDGWVTRSGYPTRFNPWLVLPEGLSREVATEYRVLKVRDADALRTPGIPELVTFLLRFDPLAARAVALRNRGALDPFELHRRVRNEGLERAATRVRLQEVAPAIPKVGEPLPAEDLEWVDLNNPAPTGAP